MIARTVLSVACVLPLVALNGCFLESNPTSPSLAGADTSFIFATTSTATTFAEGNAGIVRLRDGQVAANVINIPDAAIPNVSPDNVVRAYGGSIYILERYGADRILRIDGAVVASLQAITAGRVTYWTKIGQGVNVQDVAFAGPAKAYISQFQDTNLVIINHVTGVKIGTISLAGFRAYAGTDSAQPYPFMASLAVHGQKLYVACQRLRQSGATFVPADTSCVVVISTVDDRIVDTIPLAFRNPASMDVRGDKLYVSSTGSWGDATDGGIECIDLMTGQNAGIIVDEAALGGNITTVVMVSEQKGYVAVGKNTPDWSQFWTELVAFDPAAKTVGNRIADVDDAFGGVAYNDGRLYVGDRSATKPGVVVIDATTGTKIAGPYNVGMPPNSVAYLKVQR